MSKQANDVVIVSGCRTAIGKFGGSLQPLRAHQLAGLVMTEAVSRAGIEKGQVDEVVLGECIQCPDEANTARTASLAAGFPVEVPAYTIQKQCSSSMQALASARPAFRSSMPGSPSAMSARRAGGWDCVRGTSRPQRVSHRGSRTAHR